MALKLKGSTSGFTAIDAPAVAGDNTLVLPGGNGTSGQYLQTNGSGTLSWATVSSLSNAEDGAGTDFEFNSGYGSNATAYGVRAWINFNGNAATIGTGNASANMDAVTDNGTGDYTLNFTNNMPDANYAVTGACSGDTPSSSHQYTGHIGVVHNGFATGSCRIVVSRNQTGGEADIAWNSDKICVAFIR